MAMPDVRAFAISFDGVRKAYTCNQQSLSIPAGRTAVFGQEGYLAHSKGALQVKLTLNEITAYGQSDFKQLLDKCVKQESVFIHLYMGTKVVGAEFAIVSLEFSSQTESGVPTGTGTFEGGIPEIT